MRSGPTPDWPRPLTHRLLCARCLAVFVTAVELVAHTHAPGACPEGDA